MANIESKSMDRPDETHTPTKVTVSVVHLGTATVKRLTAQVFLRAAWRQAPVAAATSRGFVANPGGGC
jgi:hypothetical protein